MVKITKIVLNNFDLGAQKLYYSKWRIVLNLDGFSSIRSDFICAREIFIVGIQLAIYFPFHIKIAIPITKVIV